jgi:phospholipase/carboxylesterase
MSSPQDLVILLHGVGGIGADLAAVSQALRNLLPNAAFVLPDAPNRFDGGRSLVGQWYSVVRSSAGRALRSFVPNAAFAVPDAPKTFSGRVVRQWYSVVRINAAKRAERVQQAREGFDRIVAQEIKKSGFDGRLDRVAFFGFSQGANMSLDAVGTGRWPVGAVVAAAGQLVLPPGSKAASETPVLLLHGGQDSAVPVREAVLADHALKQAGFAVEARIYPDLAHSISPEGIRAAGEFLAAKLAR